MPPFPRSRARGATGAANRRRLLALWTVWTVLAWLAAGELAGAAGLVGVGRVLFTPPWPHAAAALVSAVKASLAAAFVGAAVLGAGRAATGLAGPSPSSRGGPAWLLFAAGTPLLALAVQAAGLLGLLAPVLLAGGCAAAAFPARRDLAAAVEGVRRSMGRPSGPDLVSLAAAGAVIVAALAPEVAWDAMVYHLRVPALYSLNGRITPQADLFPSFFPLTGETLMFLAREFGDDPAARLVHAAAWIASGAAVGRLSQGAWGASAASWARAVFLTIPFGMAVAARAYVEFFLVLPFVASLCLLQEGRGGPGRGRMALSGWLAGAAFGVKYLGGFCAVLAGALAFRRTGNRVRSWWPFAAAAACAAAYWLVRNALWTGNPVYPVFFGGPRWTPEDMAGWADDARAFGFDWSLLAALPWRLSHDVGADGIISPLLLLIPVAALLRPERLDPAVRRLFGLGAVLVGVWWVTSPVLRYLTPALAVVCAAGGGMAAGRNADPSARRWTAGVVLFGCWGSWLCGVKAIEFGTGAYDAALGKFSPREYRHRFFRPPGFPEALERIGAVVPRRGRAYILGHNFAYGLHRRAWVDFLFTRPALYWWLDGASSPERLRIRARQAGLTHIAWHPRGALAILGPRPDLMEWTPRRLATYLAFWDSFVREVDRFEHWTIYALRSRPQPRAPGSVFVPGTEGLVHPIETAARAGDLAAARAIAERTARRFPGYAALAAYPESRPHR